MMQNVHTIHSFSLQKNGGGELESVVDALLIERGKMIFTNIGIVPGKEIVEHYGIVQGSTVRAKHVGRDFMATLKNLVGGELRAYTELLQDSREEAMTRMGDEADKLGANAVVNIRFATSSVAQGAAELFVYGTAVRVE